MRRTLVEEFANCFWDEENGQSAWPIKASYPKCTSELWSVVLVFIILQQSEMIRRIITISAVTVPTGRAEARGNIE